MKHCNKNFYVTTVNWKSAFPVMKGGNDIKKYHYVSNWLTVARVFTDLSNDSAETVYPFVSG